MSASTTRREPGTEWPGVAALLALVWPCLLHGLRITASVTLALFVAYTLELDNAFWAGTTAAVVCQTSLGASLRKGQFRAIGTIGGGVAIVLLTAAFPQSRVGFLVGLALWCGVSGFFATILRNFAGYAAALAGYTAAIVFSDSVDAPGETFHIAITRATEIGIGVLCAGLILAVTDLGDARRRLGSALGTVANGIASGLADTLAYGPDTPASRSARRAMIRQVVMLGATIDEALGEDSNLRPRSRTLQAAVEGLYSALSAWRGVANHLDARPEEAKRWEVAALQRAMSDASGQGWVDAPEAMRQACGAQVRHVLATPAADASARFLVDRVADALLALRRAANGLVLVAAPGHERPDEGSMRLYVPDILPAIVNAIRIIVTLLAVELVWIGTNWQGGQTMVSFTALTVILFSPRATEVYACVVCFAIGTVAAAALAAIVTFAVLPAQHTFLGLSFVLACVLVPLGAISAGPWQKPFFAGMVMNFMWILAPPNQPVYDPGQFLNTAFAIVAGTIAAAISMRLIPPVSPAYLTSRLLALTLRDLRRLAVGRRWLNQRDWTGIISERIAAMPADAPLVHLAQLVAGLSVGEAVIHLRGTRSRLAGREALDKALACLATADTAGTRQWLSRFGAQQPQGEAPGALAGMRGLAAVTVIADALTQHADFFGSIGLSVRR